MPENLQPVVGVPHGLAYILHLLEFDRVFFFPKHVHHDFCDLTYLVAGSLEQLVDGKTLTMHPGDFCVIRPNQKHELHGRNTSLLNLAFPADELRELCTRSAACGDDSLMRLIWERPGTIHASVPPAMRVRFESGMQALLTLQRSAGALPALRRFLCDTVLHFLLPIRQPDLPSRLPGWLADCLDAMARKPNGDWTLDRIIQTCGRSQEHVCRTFRKHLGKSPSEFLNEHRLQQAAQLLQFTNLPVTDIAFQVGYQNLSYFHRMFRKQFAIAPSEYRAQHGEAG